MKCFERSIKFSMQGQKPKNVQKLFALKNLSNDVLIELFEMVLFERKEFEF